MVPAGEDSEREVVPSARKFADGNRAKEVAVEKVHGAPRNPGATGRGTEGTWKHEAGHEQRGLPGT